MSGGVGPVSGQSSGSSSGLGKQKNPLTVSIEALLKSHDILYSFKKEELEYIKIKVLQEIDQVSEATKLVALNTLNDAIAVEIGRDNWMEECRKKDKPVIDFNMNDEVELTTNQIYVVTEGDPESQRKILREFPWLESEEFLNRVISYGYELLGNNKNYNSDLDKFIDTSLILFLSNKDVDQNIDLVSKLYKLKLINQKKPEVAPKERKEYRVPEGVELLNQAGIERLPDKPTIPILNPELADFRKTIKFIKDNKFTQFYPKFDAEITEIAKSALKSSDDIHRVLILINAVLRLVPNDHPMEELKLLKVELETKLVNIEIESHSQKPKKVQFKE